MQAGMAGVNDLDVNEPELENENASYLVSCSGSGDSMVVIQMAVP